MEGGYLHNKKMSSFCTVSELGGLLAGAGLHQPLIHQVFQLPLWASKSPEVWLLLLTVSGRFDPLEVSERDSSSWLALAAPGPWRSVRVAASQVSDSESV